MLKLTCLSALQSDSESSPGMVAATPSGSVSGSAAGSAAGSAPSSPDSLTSTLTGLTGLAGLTGLSQLEPAQRLRSTLWQQFAGLLVPCVTRVVEFAKRVPGERSAASTALCLTAIPAALWPRLAHPACPPVLSQASWSCRRTTS